jgi:hypothetical protein
MIRLLGGDYVRLAEAVVEDCRRALAKVHEERPGEQLYGLALCVDNDATSFYIMANTLEGLLETTNAGRPAEDHCALGELTPDDLIGYPYGWVINLESGLDSNRVMSDIWEKQSDERYYDETRLNIYRAIVSGLQEFDEMGEFRSELPRDQMVLTLYQNDPDNPEWVMDWARKLNPPAAVEIFEQGYAYRVDTTSEEDQDAEDYKYLDEWNPTLRQRLPEDQIQYWIEQLDAMAAGKECDIDKGTNAHFPLDYVAKFKEAAVTPLLKLACKWADQPEWTNAEEFREDDDENETVQATPMSEVILFVLWKVKEMGYATPEVEPLLREFLEKSCRVNEGKPIWGTNPVHCADCLFTFYPEKYPEPKMAGNNALENRQEFFKISIV